MAALSYDSVEVLQAFDSRVDIDYPLLADPDLTVLGAWGLINAEVPEDSPYYGFAYPGYYLISADGTVQSRYFREENNDRVTSASILIREFDAAGDSTQGEAETPHLTARWSASNGALRTGQRLALVLDVELPEGMHVYAPEVEGYIPIAWNMTPAQGVEIEMASYPTARQKHLPAIQETVPIYEGELRVLRSVRIPNGRELDTAIAEAGELVLEGEFHYQACDADRCYLPQAIPLRWTLRLEDHDRVRAPEELQRSGN